MSARRLRILQRSFVPVPVLAGAGDGEAGGEGSPKCWQRQRVTRQPSGEYSRNEAWAGRKSIQDAAGAEEQAAVHIRDGLRRAHCRDYGTAMSGPVLYSERQSQKQDRSQNSFSGM